MILFMKKKSMKGKMNGRGERREENGMENVKSSRKKRDWKKGIWKVIVRKENEGKSVF